MKRLQTFRIIHCYPPENNKKRQNREILPLVVYVQRDDIYLNIFIMLIGRSVPITDVVKLMQYGFTKNIRYFCPD